MGSENGRTNSAVGELLLAEPYYFGFFQAVRLLERLYPDRQPVGHYAAPAEEVVRFRARASLNFPPSEVHDLKPASEDSPAEMIVTMMGLTGPSGVLPQAYTEQVMECMREWRANRSEREQEERDSEHPLVDFLDIFNHRLISLFYRAWEKYHFPLGYERGQNDVFTACLFALIGMGTKGLHGHFSFPDDSLLVYGGLLAQRPRSASALGAILGDYFSVPARVEQFVPQQLRLDDGCVTRLGVSSFRLGIDSVAGSLVWECQSKFRLVFGPLGWQQFAAFLPTGTAHRPAIELTQMIAGREFDFDIQPVLKAAEVPDTVLTTGDERQSKLGWNTWLTWANFKITERSLQKLQTEGLPAEVIAKLQWFCSVVDCPSRVAEHEVPAIFCHVSGNGRVLFEQRQCLKDYGIKGEKQFLSLLRALLGDEQAAQFHSVIMKHSQAPPVPRDADQVVLAGKYAAAEQSK